MAVSSLFNSAIRLTLRMEEFHGRAEAMGFTRDRADEALRAEQYAYEEEGGWPVPNLVRYSRAGSTPTDDECARALRRMAAG